MLLVSVLAQGCPECHGLLVTLVQAVGSVATPANQRRDPVWPKRQATRNPAPEVAEPYRTDFTEACAVLPLSPKASAALSRRTLQAILRDKAGTTKKDLYDQIEEIVTSGKYPTYLTEDLHAVRNIGNIAAHTMKSTNTGEILDVEAGEAEWNLDVLEALFDYFFVQPTIAKKRRDELNAKPKQANKPEISEIILLTPPSPIHPLSTPNRAPPSPPTALLPPIPPSPNSPFPSTPTTPPPLALKLLTLFQSGMLPASPHKEQEYADSNVPPVLNGRSSSYRHISPTRCTAHHQGSPDQTNRRHFRRGHVQ